MRLDMVTMCHCMAPCGIVGIGLLRHKNILQRKEGNDSLPSLYDADLVRKVQNNIPNTTSKLFINLRMKVTNTQINIPNYTSNNKLC